MVRLCKGKIGTMTGDPWNRNVCLTHVAVVRPDVKQIDLTWSQMIPNESEPPTTWGHK